MQWPYTFPEYFFVFQCFSFYIKMRFKEKEERKSEKENFKTKYPI
jgi:hypothetical protein